MLTLTLTHGTLVWQFHPRPKSLQLLYECHHKWQKWCTKLQNKYHVIINYNYPLMHQCQVCGERGVGWLYSLTNCFIHMQTGLKHLWSLQQADTVSPHLRWMTLNITSCREAALFLIQDLERRYQILLFPKNLCFIRKADRWLQLLRLCITGWNATATQLRGEVEKLMMNEGEV